MFLRLHQRRLLPHFSGWLLFAAASVLSTSISAAVDLHVDFGVGDVNPLESQTPNDVWAGSSDFSVDATLEGASGVVDLASVDAGVISRVFSGVTVELETGGGSLFFDGLEENIEFGSFGDLVEDGFVGSDGMILRFVDLPAGPYQMVTYHYGSSVALILAGGGLEQFDIFVDTGTGESLAMGGIAPQSEQLVTVLIPFSADGSHDVDVRLAGSLPYINGFTLMLVPEPASWLLLAMGIATVAGATRLRRRPRGRRARQRVGQALCA